MRTVTIAELKADLDQCLKEVKAGREVVIRERNRPLAKIIPLRNRASGDTHIEKLAAEGKVRNPLMALPPEFWTEPRARIPLEKLVALVSKDRDKD
jgi:prevent-host-death family protein